MVVPNKIEDLTTVDVYLNSKDEDLEITKGSSRGATLSFTLRSKGEGGQPRYLILQEIASHFSTPPPTPPQKPPTHPKSRLKTV